MVIIGGTTGIGLSAAKAFVTNGANVVVVGRNSESVAEAKTLLGGNAEAPVSPIRRSGCPTGPSYTTVNDAVV